MLFEELGLAASQTRLDTFIEAYLGDWTESVQALPNLPVWLAHCRDRSRCSATRITNRWWSV